MRISQVRQAVLQRFTSQREYAALTCTIDTHYRHAAWSCKMDMLQGHAAGTWTCSMNIEMDMDTDPLIMAMHAS